MRKFPEEGQHAVVIGRSNIVGKPLSLLLQQRNATVTMCHSKTRDIKRISREADILIVAIGKAHFLTKDMVKKGAVVIDVGINKVGNTMVGDVDFEAVQEKASDITPGPGGGGPIAIAMLLKKTVKASKG